MESERIPGRRRLIAATLGFLFVVSVAIASRPGTPPGSRQAGAAPVASLVISLSLAGENLTPDVPPWPLMIRVVISNPRAANVRTHNAGAEAAMRQLKESGRFEQMSADERKQIEQTFARAEVPSATLGSKNRPVWSLVTMDLEDASGRKVSVPTRPLAITRENTAPATLDGTAGAWMLFGLDADEIAKIRPGSYRLRAHLNTEGAADMWQGRLESLPAVIEIAAEVTGVRPEELNVRDYLAGEYHLNDRAPNRARVFADRILARDSSHVAGLTLSGDIYNSQNRLQDAERAYEAGLAAFEKHLSVRKTPLPVDGDHPSYLLQQLSNVRSRIQGKEKRPPEGH